ncbi:hypothetical protein [Roseibium alexandrii]|jgi:hypothetical protein|uniref:hypothetical protein n=1 Tax=Roseibium alexandrii TaxID=388408 RepID=UPI003750B92C
MKEQVVDKEAESKGSEKPAPAPFTIGYDRRNSEAIVYGCMLLAGLFAVVSVVSGMYLLLFAALGPAVIAYWHFPMLEKKRPQLGANEDGLFVDRIGFIDWGAIRMIDLTRTSVRSIELIKLNVLLTRPLEDAVTQGQYTPLWKRFTMRNWKRSKREHGRELISVNLHTLVGDPDEVLTRIRTFKFV